MALQVYLYLFLKSSRRLEKCRYLSMTLVTLSLIFSTVFGLKWFLQLTSDQTTETSSTLEE